MQAFECFSCSDAALERIVRCHGSRDAELFSTLAAHGSFRSQNLAAFSRLLRGGTDAATSEPTSAALASALERILDVCGTRLAELRDVGGDAEGLAARLGGPPPLSLLNRHVVTIVAGERGCRLLAWSHDEVLRAVPLLSTFIERCEDAAARGALSAHDRRVVDEHFRPLLAALAKARDDRGAFVVIPPHANDASGFGFDDPIVPLASFSADDEAWAYFTWTLVSGEIDTPTIAALFGLQGNPRIQTLPRQRALHQDFHPSPTSEDERPLAVFRTPGWTWISESTTSLLVHGVSGAWRRLSARFDTLGLFQCYDPGWYAAVTRRDGTTQSFRCEDGRPSLESAAGVFINQQRHVPTNARGLLAALCAYAGASSLAAVFSLPDATVDVVARRLS